MPRCAPRHWRPGARAWSPSSASVRRRPSARPDARSRWSGSSLRARCRMAPMPPSWWWPMSRSGRLALGSRRPPKMSRRCTASSVSGWSRATARKGKACAFSMAARSSHRMRASSCGWRTSTARSSAARASRLRIFSGSHARADGEMSALLVALAQDVAHHFADDRRQRVPQTMQIGAQTVHFTLQTVKPALQVVKSLVVAVESGLDRCQVVAIAAGLLEDVASDGFLALDLALDNVHARLEVVELFPAYVRRHSHGPYCLDSNIA